MSRQLSEEGQHRILYVRILNASVSEELLCALLSQISPIKSCNIISAPENDSCAFLEFINYREAATALAVMDKRKLLEKGFKMYWINSSRRPNRPKHDLSKHHHIFVGNLSPEIKSRTLRRAFAPFGNISSCKIIRDPHTLKSKGFGFISYFTRAEAENAIEAMNGQWLGRFCIRTNWSNAPPGSERPCHQNKILNFDDVYNQTGPSNRTVYCGGVRTGISNETLRRTFSTYGTVEDIRLFKRKGYAFITYFTKESAAHAIVEIHNTKINGKKVKCFWGKENKDPNNPKFEMGQPKAEVSYSYPESYQAAAQMEGQYLHGMKPGYPYSGGEFGYYMSEGSLGAHLPGATWEGIAAQPPVLPQQMQVTVMPQEAAGMVQYPILHGQMVQGLVMQQPAASMVVTPLFSSRWC